MSTTHAVAPITLTSELPDRRPGAALAIAGGVALLLSFVVVPGPDVADVHQGGWVPGHALSVAAFLLLALGFPAVYASLGRRAGVLGVVGYVAVMARFVLSTGSHLYSLWILPTLAKHPELHSDLVPDARLASIYGGHGAWFNLALGVGMTALAVSLFRYGRGLRTVSALVLLAAVFELVGLPFGLIMLAVVNVWLGLRLFVRGSVLAPLR